MPSLCRLPSSLGIGRFDRFQRRCSDLWRPKIAHSSIADVFRNRRWRCDWQMANLGFCDPPLSMEYRVVLKGGPKVVWNWMKKLCFVWLFPYCRATFFVPNYSRIPIPMRNGIRESRITQILHCCFPQEAWNEKVFVLRFRDFWLRYPYFRILRNKMRLILK